MSVKGVSVQLFDANGAAIASTSGIEVLWYDADTIPEISLLYGSNAVVSTDGSGWINLDLSVITGLSVGEWGFLVCYKQDGGDYRSSPVFMSQMQVANITSGDVLGPATTWVRNPAWLALPDTTGLQKFAGLHAVYPTSNFIALSAAGNYTVDWGDGTGGHNTSSGVTAETNLNYTLYPASSDVGIYTALACTFTDSSNKVNLTAHGFKNGQEVSFDTIVSTTGISTHTYYYVVNTAANDFQVALTPAGSAIGLVTDGSGTVYIPQYRQAIVTVVPNGGNITQLNLHVKNSTSGLQLYSTGWLDIEVCAAYMTDMRFAVATPGSSTQTVQQAQCEQISIVNSSLRQLDHLFYSTLRLRNIKKLVTDSSAWASLSCTFTDAGDTVNINSHGFRDGDPVIFTSITSTTGISVDFEYYVRDAATNTFKVANTYGGTALALTTNGSGTALRGTSFWNTFYLAFFDSIPILDTSQCINTGGMFIAAWIIQQIPKLDLSKVRLASGMFNGCSSLKSVPAFDLSACVNFTNLFISCTGLRSVPAIPCGMGTTFTSMFSGCRILSSVALGDTAAGLSFDNMFVQCYALSTVPLFDTGAGTNFSNMFSTCPSLQSIPAYDTRSGTLFTSMFLDSNSLKRGVLYGTTKHISYTNCELSGAELDAIYTALGTGTSQIITVTNNWGNASDTPSIATAKGWTVSG